MKIVVLPENPEDRYPEKYFQKVLDKPRFRVYTQIMTLEDTKSEALKKIRDRRDFINLPTIPKAQLKHGHWYRGICRNAPCAIWDGQAEKFMYIRHKFDMFFMEVICHPEDDDGFDLFEPKEVIAWV